MWGVGLCRLFGLARMQLHPLHYRIVRHLQGDCLLACAIDDAHGAGGFEVFGFEDGDGAIHVEGLIPLFDPFGSILIVSTHGYFLPL